MPTRPHETKESAHLNSEVHGTGGAGTCMWCLVERGIVPPYGMLLADHTATPMCERHEKQCREIAASYLEMLSQR